MNQSDILLYDANDRPLVVYDTSYNSDEGLYFSPIAWENIGKFEPSLLYSPLGTGEQDVNQYDREMLLRVSRKLYSVMPEVAAASGQLANLTVGLGFSPIFKGDNAADKEWGENTEINLESNFFNSCSPYGMAYDWRTIWKLVSFLVDRDGDVLLVPYTDRYGALRLTFYEAHRIANRPGQLKVDGGKFDGYEIRDGIILNDYGYPIGYQLLGYTPDEDRQLSTSQAQLIYNPFSFSKFRGIPSITYAMRSAASLREITAALEMVAKIESMIFLQIKNERGQAPRKQVKFLLNPNNNAATQTTKTAGLSVPVYQDIVGGIKYTRHKDEMKSFNSNRPAQELMKFVEHLEKGILLGTGIPYQWILNPESVSGASSRGIKEQITKAVQSRYQMLSKYANVCLVKAVVNGMATGMIDNNFRIDPKTKLPVFSQWGVTSAAELMLDIGYEKQADINSLLVGLSSYDEILQKYGKRYKQVLNTKAKNLRDLLDTVKTLQADYPEFATSILPLMQKEDFIPPPLPAEPAPQAKV